MSAGGGREAGIPTPTVAKIARVARSTLNHWASIGLCEPTLVTSSGHRATRYWSVRDVVIVRTIKKLRDSGCSMPRLKAAVNLLRDHWDLDLADAVLVWDGKDLLSIDDRGTVVSLLAERGQSVVGISVMQLVTLPLSVWLEEAMEIAEPVDITTIRARRAKLTSERAEGHGVAQA